jgi:hypothetical protein
MTRAIDYGIPEMGGAVMTIMVGLHHHPLRFANLLREMIHPGGYCQGIVFSKEYW